MDKEEVTNIEGETGVEDRSQNVVEMPFQWQRSRLSPTVKRGRIIECLSDWAKRRVMTTPLLSKLIQGPLSEEELSKYTSNQIARIVYAVGLMKKTQQLNGNPIRVQHLIEIIKREAVDRKRLLTYDSQALSQTAFGFSMMELNDPELFVHFAEEAVKSHRIRNTVGKCLVNLLDALRSGNYVSDKHIEILSKAAVEHIETMPTYSLPKLMAAWGHYRFKNQDVIRPVLQECLKKNRLNAFLANHVEEILVACARLQLREPKIITLFVRELIYSQKWRFMNHGSLPIIIRALGDLQYEQATHWKTILEATLNSKNIESLESKDLVDVYIGWSKATFRESRLADQLGTEAIKKTRLEEYSTRQLFEIFKAQRFLGQIEVVFTNPVVQRLQETEKLLKCNLETKIKIFVYPNMKKVLGMKNMASLAKAIFQPICVEKWNDDVLLSLANSLVLLGKCFDVCFEEIAKEFGKAERLKAMEIETLCSLLMVWHQMDYEDKDLLQRFLEEASKNARLQSSSEQQLLKLLWTFTSLKDFYPDLDLNAIVQEISKRPKEVFTDKGLEMLQICLDKQSKTIEN